jgi:uncharacterized RDD family membrane protein YckC
MQIQDPSNTELKHETASIQQRVLALFIDVLIILALLYLFKQIGTAQWNKKYFKLISAIIYMVYKPLLEYILGATIGKILLGLKVVNYQYKKPSLGAILLRNISLIVENGYKISLILVHNRAFKKKHYNLNIENFKKDSPFHWVAVVMVGFYLIDFMVMVFQSRHQSLHDLLARTIVVKK